MGDMFIEKYEFCPLIEGTCRTFGCALYQDGECCLRDTVQSLDAYGDMLDGTLDFIAGVLVAIADKLGADLSGVANPKDKHIIVRKDAPDVAVRVGVTIGSDPIPIAEFEAWWSSTSPRGEI